MDVGLVRSPVSDQPSWGRRKYALRDEISWDGFRPTLVGSEEPTTKDVDGPKGGFRPTLVGSEESVR